MKKIAVFLFINILCLLSFAQSFYDKDSIFEISKTAHKNVFLVFSGSDWCANCIRFDKKIMQDPVFQDFIHANLIYLNADFPQRKKQSHQLVEQNEALAEKYNKDGIFPCLLLISPNQKVLTISYLHETAAQFIGKIKKALTALNEND